LCDAATSVSEAIGTGVPRLIPITRSKKKASTLVVGAFIFIVCYLMQIKSTVHIFQISIIIIFFNSIFKMIFLVLLINYITYLIF